MSAMEEKPKGLSPVSRRAFLQNAGKASLAALPAIAALALAADGAIDRTGGETDFRKKRVDGKDGDKSCGYCDGCNTSGTISSDYYHCDGDYCTYSNASLSLCDYSESTYSDSNPCQTILDMFTQTSS